MLLSCLTFVLLKQPVIAGSIKFLSFECEERATFRASKATSMRTTYILFCIKRNAKKVSSIQDLTYQKFLRLSVVDLGHSDTFFLDK